VISARTDTVNRAVKLIDPDEHRRPECVTAVTLALANLNASEADLRRVWTRNSTRGRRTAAQLEKAIGRLLDILDDPTAPNLAKKDETKPLLRHWQRRAGSMARDRITPPFRFKAEKKLTAALFAHNLLYQFNRDRDISATEGSRFCQLAALLHGTPKAKFQSPCRMILRNPLSILNPYVVRSALLR
jgi:hypothetical protein